MHSRHDRLVELIMTEVAAHHSLWITGESRDDAVPILMLSVAAAMVAVVTTTAEATAQPTTGYTAVWRPGTGAQWWRSSMTTDEFKAQDDTYFKQGLRIRSLAIRGGRFTAVWQSGTGARFWRSGMTTDEFKAQDDTATSSRGCASPRSISTTAASRPCGSQAAARNFGARA